MSFSMWLPSFVAAAVLFAAALTLWLRFRRQARDKDALTVRLRLAGQALELTPLPILRLDAGLRVVAANQSARQAYIHERGSLIGAGLFELLPELANHPDVIALQAAEQGQTPLPDDEAALGKRHDADALGHLMAITDQGRRQIFWFGTTPFRQDQEQYPGEADPVEESAIRMKSEFIANINHEVRTPLNAIIGYTEMLVNSQLGGKEKRFVSIIHKSSMALVSIFNDIMDLSKIDSNRLQIEVASIRLQSIVNDVDGLFEYRAEEKGIRFTCRVAGHLPEYIRFDGVRLKQVLHNLVGNAIKFTTEGAVTLEVDGVPAKNKPGCLDLRLVVEDTGIGISEADRRKIINLFQQGRKDTRHFDGVGLGLTLCSRLTAMMGGRIELASKEGEGTKFVLLFDGVEMVAPIPVRHAAPASEQPLRAGQKKLLVVDDVDLIKDFFFDLFQDSPYQVFTANSNTEAMTIARNERPDLIFMDLNLNGSDGRKVTKQLREHPDTASIPVVVMTGYILEEADYRPLFDDFLQKPFRLEKLQEVVDRYAPILSAVMEQPTHAAGGENEESETVALLDSTAWNDELESLLLQAVFSGSLTDAAALGSCMRQRGLAERQSVMTRVGDELLQHAQEPNILGVERLLTRLYQMAGRSESS